MFASARDQIMLPCPPRPLPMESKWKSNLEVAPNCPRCASSNTKFCYYNNYSLSQPRYFCKGCRRYWTKGGSLRNVPVGGGCRKNRRSRSVRPASDRGISVNYGKNLSSFDRGSNESLLGDACATTMDSIGQLQGGATDGSDIDLAVVFAKFLNQDSGNNFEPEMFGGPELANNVEANEFGTASNSLNQGYGQDEAKTVQLSQEASDLVQDFDLLEGLPSQLLTELQREGQERIHQEVISGSDHEMNAFGLQTLLSDEMMVQDALWPEDAPASTLSQSVTWQPMVQLQEFDAFPADEQLKIPANLLGSDANWSSFDFSGFEVFSRP